MNDKEKVITERIKTALQLMTDLEKDRLLGFVDGVAFLAIKRAEQPPADHPRA